MAWLRAPIALFLVALVAIGGVAMAAVAMHRVIRVSDIALAQAAIGLGEAERLRSLRERVSRKARTFLFMNEGSYLDELRDAEAAFHGLLSTLSVAAKTPEERELVERLGAQDRMRLIASNRLIDQRQSGANTDSVARALESDLQPTLDTLDATMARLVEHHRREVEHSRAEATETSSKALVVVWIAAGLAALISAFSSLALARTLRRIEGRSARTRSHLAAIVESSEDAVYSKDLEGRVLTWNKSAERVFGYPSQEILGRHVSSLVPSKDLAEDTPQILAQIRAGQPVPHLETLRKAKDGRLIDVVLSISPVKDEAGRVTSASIIARDVTEQRRLRRERDRFFELSLDMVCVAGTDGYFKQINPTFQLILGHPRAELLEQPFLEFVHPEDREATMQQVATLSTGGSTIDFENRYRCKDGSYKWLSWHATAEPDGTIYALARDVTERMATQEKLVALADDLRIMAVVDELTGLHNRRGFNILAAQELKRADRHRQKALFFFADVDGLKQINDQLGHDVGDRAIRDAATLLRSAFRSSDIVSRIGGDEFAILCTGGASDWAQAPLERLEDLVRQYNSSVPPQPFALAISIGSTNYDPEQPETIDAVLKRADKVMYEQKARRKAAAQIIPKTPATAASHGSRTTGSTNGGA